jgi:uroporphyrinogen-III synthase
MANNAQTSDRPVLLLTRPQDRSDHFAAQLAADVRDAVRICVSPLLEIVPTGACVDLSAAAGVIFTSVQGVNLAPSPTAMPAFCVGRETAKMAKRAGWDVQITAQDAAHLVSALKDVGTRGPLTHLAGRNRRGDIAEHLARADVIVHVVTLYDQVLRPLSDEAQMVLKGEAPVILPLFSPRTAVQFVAQAESLAKVHAIAISDSVGNVVRDLPIAELHIVNAPNGREMRLGVEMLLRSDTLP